MRIYCMAYDYGDGSSGVIFSTFVPDEAELSNIEFESMIGNINDGTWITLPDDLDLKAAGIELWKSEPKDSG